jgi:hypothetical protein
VTPFQKRLAELRKMATLAHLSSVPASDRELDLADALLALLPVVEAVERGYTGFFLLKALDECERALIQTEKI